MTAIHDDRYALSSESDGLPNSFICSMRTLFDIMDDQHLGYIKFSEIERRWQEDGTQGLPDGVLQSLRKVTPPNGFLSFERFCTGLKMSLGKNKEKGNNDCFMTYPFSSADVPPIAYSSTTSLETIPPLKVSSPQTSPRRRVRPLSAPLLDKENHLEMPLSSGMLINSISGSSRMQYESHAMENKIPPRFNTGYNVSNYDTVPSKPNTRNPMDSQVYTISKRPGSDDRQSRSRMSNVPNLTSYSSSTGPPKPPRAKDSMADLGQNLNPRLELRQSAGSLERESRGDKRDASKHERRDRKVRGGSLERLLDSHNDNTKNFFGHPLSKTGMRSALQSWFREKTKSEPVKGDANNNCGIKIADKYSEHIYENSRAQNMQNTVRGIGDGGDSHRVPPRPSQTMGGVYGRVEANAQSSNKEVPPKSSVGEDVGIYGSPLERAFAVPAISKGFSPYKEYDDGQLLQTAQGLYVAPQPPQVAVHKKTSKKREPRRRTLPNGMDQNGMKRLQELEAERDMLYQGIDVVEKAKSWFKSRLHKLEKQMHYLPLDPNQSETTLDAQREKLHFQLARIHEINAHLQALMEVHEDGFPTHMNLAFRTTLTSDKRVVNKLKEQNKLLTEEVSHKSEQITNLEREKAALFRELFQARASQRAGSGADSTFM